MRNDYQDLNKYRYCYVPVENGYKINITEDDKIQYAKPGSRIGAMPTIENPYHIDFLEPITGERFKNVRKHRRPLYPPSVKSMIWDETQLDRIEAYCFRPLVLAYNEPRFLLDFHLAGGALGHLYLGLVAGTGNGKWFHDWSDIRVTYNDGHMEYEISDADFPGIEAVITASALADSVGVVVKVDVKGLKKTVDLILGYGGASAFFTNWELWSEELNYSAKHCENDVIRLYKNGFELTRDFYESDVYMQQGFAAARHIPGWKAVIHGGNNENGLWGFGDPGSFQRSPGVLAGRTQWHTDGNSCVKKDCVAVYSVKLEPGNSIKYFVAGMGKKIKDEIGMPEKAMEKALKRNREISSRVVANTPDPYLDAAVKMASFVTDGVWGDEATLHGALSWRFGYLGWRGWYGLNCYGWQDRIKTAIENHIRLSLIKEGPDKGVLSSLLESNESVSYNMNELFIDQVRHYYEYSGDVELVKKVYPIVKNIVKWQETRLQPGNEYLFENCLNVQISDSHWYIGGQCTISSSYMIRANEFLAVMAEVIGEDPSPFRQKAELIKNAMQRKLWQADKGVFAEFLDTRGNRMLHPEPSLPSIIHSSEFGAASTMQIYQMLNWVKSNLGVMRTESGGKLYWNSNWSPHYSHWEPFYGDNLNLALTGYLAGDAEEAYSLIRGVMRSVYNGPTPGGFGSGLSENNDDFTDTTSMWNRTIIEGLFGIILKKHCKTVVLTPQLPDDWEKASISTPHFSYEWTHNPGTVKIAWQSPENTIVRIRIPVKARSVESVLNNKVKSDYRLKPGFGFTWVETETLSDCKGEICVEYKQLNMAIPDEETIKQGDGYTLDLNRYGAVEYVDPQGILGYTGIEDGVLKAMIKSTPGHHVFFIFTGNNSTCPMWVPVRINVLPQKSLGTSCLPVQKPPDRDLKYWYLIDLGNVYNASSPAEILETVAQAAIPPESSFHQVGFDYRRQHMLGYCARHNKPPVDVRWRGKTGEDGIAWTEDGIPFKTSKYGPNTAAITLEGGYPENLSFSAGMKGRELYLMISGITWPVQSHVVNLRVILHYEDGIIEAKDLVNPYDISSCWGLLVGEVFHDIPSSRFENIGGRYGPSGSANVDDMSKIFSVDTIAQLVPFPLRHDIRLDTVEVKAVANDIVFGVMGATILK